MLVAALVSVLCGAALAGAAPVRQVGVEDAEAELAAAQQAYDDAGAVLREAIAHRREVSGRAVELEGRLRELDSASLRKVLAFETMISDARDLAVSAYVRGGTQADLDNYLDAEAATEVVLRLHLVIGRVDQAQEAASALKSERIVVDAEAADVAARVAAVNAELNDADAGVAAAEAAERAGYAALLVAIDNAGAAEAAARVAAAEAAAAAARASAGRGGSDGEGRSSGVPDTTTTTTAAEDGGTDTETAVPFVPPSTSNDQADGWAKLRDCESGGNYQAIGGGGLYRGAYQFSQGTWEGVGGTGDPAEASPAEQDYRARLLYERSGAGQWPLCGRYLR